MDEFGDTMLISAPIITYKYSFIHGPVAELNTVSRDHHFMV